MSEQKNIDKLFQEKFKDFEADPSEFTWPELKERLEKKKKKRIIPFWWKLSGIAAALLIGFFVAQHFSPTKIESTNAIIVEQNNKQNNSQEHADPLNDNQNNAKAVARSGIDSVSNTQKSDRTQVADAEKISGNENPKNEKPANPILNKSYQNPIVQSGNTNPEKDEIANPNSAVQKKRAAGSKKQRSTNLKSNAFSASETAVANHDPNATSNSGQQKTKSAQNSDLKNQRSETALARNEITKKLNTKNSDQAVANENTTGSKSSELPNKALSQTTEKQNPVAATEEKESKKIDSTAVTTVVPNALEELLKEKEKKLVAKGPKLNRWQISSSVAPVYLGSSSQGSPIDSSFARNSKDFGTNVSFGLGVNYAVSKKFKIRTGVNKVALNYHTNDVFINAGIQAKTLENITVSNQNQNLNVSSGGGGSTKGNNALQSEFATDTFESYLNQKMAYIEVPLELSYAVLDEKFGIDIIGGFSSLFLNENEIQVVSSGYTTNLGEANNLNKTHFSTNIGLGLRYRFFSAFEANFNPMFKYQMDTFSRNDGNFKPYFFGLYTGVSFKF